MIIAGHGRLEAAKQLAFESVPTITISGLNDREKAALRLADNKIAENATWDPKLLIHEIQFIGQELDVTDIGFETAELDRLMGSGPDSDAAADAVPEIDVDTRPVSSPDDCYQLGRHRLMCGDARDVDYYRLLMDGEQAQMAFTDPPYNVPIDGNVGGLGSIRHREFAMASGEMSPDEFTGFLCDFMRPVRIHCVDGAILYVFMDWRHVVKAVDAGNAAGLELKNMCVWNKTNGGMGSLYRSKHEFVLVFKSGDAPHINNIELGQHGRYRTNVWDYAGANTFGADRLTELQSHPSVKPVALVADAIRDCSHRGGIILDCFVGSGTTIIAAEITERRAFAMEIDPLYVDTAIRRWQSYTGGEALNAERGQTFANVARFRSQPTDSSAENGQRGTPGGAS